MSDCLNIIHSLTDYLLKTKGWFSYVVIHRRQSQTNVFQMNADCLRPSQIACDYRMLCLLFTLGSGA